MWQSGIVQRSNYSSESTLTLSNRIFWRPGHRERFEKTSFHRKRWIKPWIVEVRDIYSSLFPT